MYSTPVYKPLQWDPSGLRHILLVEAAHAGQISRLLDDLPSALSVIVVGRSPEGAELDLRVSVPCAVASDLEAGLDVLSAELERASMGCRLYLLGNEHLVWEASRRAAKAGLGEAEIQRERAGAPARPMFCVHCRTTTPDVTATVAPCSGCGRTLFVRDHFSRQLGAYMAFQIDAEEPGLIPEAERFQS